MTMAEETQPLLRDADAEQQQPDLDTSKHIVDFDPAGDQDNPRDWPVLYKWGIVGLLAFMAFTVTFTCVSVVPVANRIVFDLSGGQHSKSASVLLVTIWELGEAAGPLFIAPLSEVYGRYPVFNGANVLFIGATILAALCQDASLFIGARALTGLAVASNVLNPAIVGDMFIPEQRGSAMSIIMLAPLIGGAVGPAISGAIAENLGWRWILWMSVILASACELAFLTLFRETYKVPILRRKALKLRKETGDDSFKTVFDDEKQSLRKIWESVMRPAVVLFGSGVLQIMSLFGAFGFTFFYIMSTTLPDILGDIYGLSPAQTGSCYMVFSIGSIFAVIICNLTLDRIYVKLRDYNGGEGQPEYRLPLVIFGGFSLPIVVAAFGWVAQARLPLPVFLVTLGLLGTTLAFGFLPLLAYVVDAFKLYSASAMTAVIVTRCLMGTFLPLTTAPLVQELGYGWAFTILGSICISLGPIPVFVFRYGAKWRQRSKYSKDE